MRDEKPRLGIWDVAIMVAIVGTMAACNLNFLKNTNAPTPVASPSPSPSPTPSPSASPSPGASGVSDVDSMIVLVYGYTCPAGIDPNHAAGIIPKECTHAQLTATPKQKAGACTTPNCDAVNHGNDITWTVAPAPDGNFPGQVVPQDSNPLFNREVKAKNAQGDRVPGSVTLTATLKAPDGKAFQASKVVTVAP